MARIKTKDGYEYNDFQKSNRSLSLGKQLESAEKNMPKIQDYDKKYASMADDAMNRILNRKDFEYDMNADALYNQYKDQYIRSGKRAMQDTIAANNQAAGAYGNTYGVTAASQAYQNYLLGLNDKIPELYALAESRYNKEGEDLYNKYGLLSGRDETEYGRQGDLVSQAQNDRNYYYNAESDSYNRDYNAWGNDRDFGYNGYRNGISDNQWQSQFDESKRQYDTSLAEQQRQYNTNLAEERRQYDSNLSYQREKAAYDNAIALMNAQNKDSDTKAKKDATEEMFETALEEYRTGGDVALDRYLSKFPGYDVDKVIDYVVNYDSPDVHSGAGGKYKK